MIPSSPCSFAASKSAVAGADELLRAADRSHRRQDLVEQSLSLAERLLARDPRRRARAGRRPRRSPAWCDEACGPPIRRARACGAAGAGTTARRARRARRSRHRRSPGTRRSLASAIPCASGYWFVQSRRLRVCRRTTPPSTNASVRTPSHFGSNANSGESNGSSAVIASIGSILASSGWSFTTGPCLIISQSRPFVLLGLHEDPLALETLSVERDLVFVLAVLDQVVRALVPDRHRARAVAVGDDAVEVQVLDRVVLGVDREAALAALERRTLRHRPRREDAAHLEADVPVQARGVMPVHHVAAGRLCLRALAFRLGRPLEVAFALVFLEAHAYVLPANSRGRCHGAVGVRLARRLVP